MPLLTPDQAKEYAPLLGPLASGICGFFGAIFGASAVLVVNWYQVRAKGRENLDAWFEKYAVTEGIEPVLFSLLTLKTHFFSRMGIENTPVVSAEALQRVCTLLGNDTICMVFYELHIILSYCENPETGRKAEIELNKLSKSLEKLQKVLIGKKLRRKSDVFLLRDLQAVSEVKNEIRRLHFALKPLCEDAGVFKVLKSGWTSTFRESVSDG